MSVNNKWGEAGEREGNHHWNPASRHQIITITPRAPMESRYMKGALLVEGT